MKRKAISSLLLTALCLLGSVAWASTTWYVNGVTGTDSNNCKSLSTACKTIGHAISLASSGDSIMIGAATYTDTLTININLKVIGSGASTTIVDGAGANVFFFPSTATIVTLSMLTISGANGDGVANNGTLTINNSTISGNVTGGGSGIHNNGTLTINNSTISGNSAKVGGGISGPATLQNSIVANNSGGNCSGTITSKGYNLSSDSTCSLNGPGDMQNTDPVLGSLQYNGGPTQTLALLPGSPAIDAGNPSGCKDNNGNLLTTDQRGMPRPDKEDTGGCDMGAYERQSD
jgi:hypothetical protein